MIILFNNKENKELFENDIRALLTAFYGTIEIRAEYGDESMLAAGDDAVAIDISALSETFSGKKEDGDIAVTISSGMLIKSAPVTFNADETENHAIRRCIKWTLYLLLREKTGRDLPWGSLTGVRPVSLVSKMLERGLDAEAALAEYRSEYFVSEEKAKLACDIAELQRSLLTGRCDDSHYSLYVGIPFCPTTCLYCSFTSYPVGAYAELMKQYVDVLKQELTSVSEIFAGKILDTIYVGGGTPSTLTEEQTKLIFDTIYQHFDTAALREITFEAGRPDSITESKLRLYKDCGVTRISINPQTMNDETLKLIGRHHTSAQTAAAFEMARKMGFSDINMDIILGLPGEREEQVEYTLKEIERLSPDSLTIHSLAVKRGSRLNELLVEKKIDMENYHITPQIMQLCQEAVARMDMHPYYLYRQKKITDNFENTGYAKEGKYCLYNISTMEEVQNIVACGAGTVSKRVYGDGHIERCDNVKDVELYISKIEEMVERKRALFSE